jgi:hypothetical protein
VVTSINFLARGLKQGPVLASSSLDGRCTVWDLADEVLQRMHSEGALEDMCHAMFSQLYHVAVSAALGRKLSVEFLRGCMRDASELALEVSPQPWAPQSQPPHPNPNRRSCRAQAATCSWGGRSPCCLISRWQA